jgi:hypothetical protein
VKPCEVRCVVIDIDAMRLTVDPNGERHGELSLSPVKLTGFKIAACPTYRGLALELQRFAMTLARAAFQESRADIQLAVPAPR